MKNNKITAEYPLTNAGIEACLAKAEEMPENAFRNARSKKAVLLRLEDVLLGFSKHFGEDRIFMLSVRKTFGTYRLSVSVAGEYYDPLRDTYSSPELQLFDRKLSAYGAGFEHEYRNGENRITASFAVKAQIPELLMLFFMILAGAAVGGLCLLLPESIRAYPCRLIGMAQNIIMNLISLVTLPIVFFSVIEGVTACGSVEVFESRGFRTVKAFFLVSLAVLTVTSGVCFFLFDLPFEAGGASSGVFEMICSSFEGMFPSNIAASFAGGNMLQVVLIGILLGCAILVTNGGDGQLPARLNKVCGLFAVILQWFCKLIPAAFACMVAINVMNGSFVILLGSYPVLLTVLGLFAVITAVMVTVTAAKTGISAAEVVRSIIKPMTVALSTASALAAFPVMKETLTKRFHVGEDYASVSLSMGMTFFSPGDTAGNLVMLLFFAHIAGIGVSAGWIVSGMLLSFIFAIATPAVPGVTAAAVLMLFEAQGIPAEWSLIASLCAILLDYPETFFRTGAMMMVCACRAVSLDACDKEK